MHSSISRRRRRKRNRYPCRWCGKPALKDSGRRKCDRWHDLCAKCWAAAKRIGKREWRAHRAQAEPPTA